MRNKLGGICLLTALVIASLAGPAMAGTTQPVKRVSTPKYDASKETTINGTVASIKVSVPGRMTGAHLFLTSGTDAHLGPYAMNGSHGVKVSAGQQVKLVGVMTSFRGSQVFLVRTVDTGSKTYTVRNEHGFPVIMGVAAPSRSLTAVKGGAR